MSQPAFARQQRAVTRRGDLAFKQLDLAPAADAGQAFETERKLLRSRPVAQR